MATKNGLTLEQKRGWMEGVLAGNTRFIHCSGARPDLVRKSGGLDPMKSREWCESTNPLDTWWRWNRFVFGFLYDGSLPVKPPKAARQQGFAAGGYIYDLTQPAGTLYMTDLTFGAINAAKEVGFPELIPMARIANIYKWEGGVAKDISDVTPTCRCYITTATCESLGLADDCDELERLRWFRDEVLARDAEGRQAIRLYYETAPRIVAAIDAAPERAAIYREIHRTHLGPAVAAVREGRYSDAYDAYRQLVEMLRRRLDIRTSR